MIRFVGGKHQSAVWGQTSVCHGNQLGLLIMLSLSLDRNETSTGTLMIPKFDGGAAVIFICVQNDPLRSPAGIPRERAAEMMCILKVCWAMPSASMPVGSEGSRTGQRGS